MQPLDFQSIGTGARSGIHSPIESETEAIASGKRRSFERYPVTRRWKSIRMQHEATARRGYMAMSLLLYLLHLRCLSTFLHILRHFLSCRLLRFCSYGFLYLLRRLLNCRLQRFRFRCFLTLCGSRRSL